MTWVKVVPAVQHADPHLDARGYCRCCAICCVDSTDGKCKCDRCLCGLPPHPEHAVCSLCRPFPVSCQPVRTPR